MLKWILGCLGVAVIIVACVLWYGYRKLKTFASEGPSSTVTIMAPASRVFASIADVDSMTEWRTEGLGIRASHRGLLRVGDTVQAQSGSSASNRRSRTTWLVTAVIPDTLLALEVRNDSTGAAVFSRRDSIIALGDSTRVVSTFVANILDSLRRGGDTLGRTRGAMVDLASNVMVAGMRVMSDLELKRLKMHIEGRTAPDSTPRPPQKKRD